MFDLLYLDAKLDIDKIIVWIHVLKQQATESKNV